MPGCHAVHLGYVHCTLQVIQSLGVMEGLGAYICTLQVIQGLGVMEGLGA